jgi:hypothetical protein
MSGILWAVVQSPITWAPRFTQGRPHHCTLQYDVERKDWATWEGITFTAHAIAHCHDYAVQAIAIALPQEIPCANLHPHITVSWRQGHTPSESNQMLAGLHRRTSVDYPIAMLIKWYEFPGDGAA